MSRMRASAVLVSGVAVLMAVGCGPKQDTTPPVAAAQVTLARSKVPLGSPLEMTYRFTVAADAPSLGARRVFVHFLDADEELMWADDHDPPTSTMDWKPGQTIEYTRTLFVPSYPYVGAAKVVAGLYTAGANDRLKLSNEDRGDRAYTLADFELLPQTENIFLIFKDGWHPSEVVADGAGRTEWQWTKKEATIAFRNPKRDATLFLQVDNPALGPTTAQQVTLQLGDQVLATVPLTAADAALGKYAITAAQFGTGEMVEIRLVADRTFVPALEPGTRNPDPRELGVRVFHAFVQ